MKYYTNPLVVTDHCTFSTTVSIMGIDSQGINRGKCSCGECVEFVRGSGVLCGYCECVPVRHEKVTDPNSSTTEYKDYTRWANYPTKKQPLEWCLTWMDPRSKRLLYSLFQFPFGRILPVFLGDMSIERKLPSGIYQGKKAPKFPILLP